MCVKLLNEHNLEFLSLKEGCTGSSESTFVHMPHCWKSHVTVQLLYMYYFSVQRALFYSNAFGIHDMYTGQRWSAVAQIVLDSRPKASPASLRCVLEQEH